MVGLPSAETERLRLERWDPAAHGPALAEINAQPEVMRFCHPLWWPAMVDRVEVGWRLRREAWRFGYATEGARAAVHAGFASLGLREIVAFVHPENERSLAVTRRLGMVEEAELPHPSRDHAVKVLRTASAPANRLDR
jgi:hypothetical protein